MLYPLLRWESLAGLVASVGPHAARGAYRGHHRIADAPWTFLEAKNTMARLAGLEPTASASAGLSSIQLSYKRALYKQNRQRQ